MCLVSILMMGCTSNNQDNTMIENIENHIPYIDENNGEIDNKTISERYENVKKEELSYNKETNEKEVKTEVFRADSIKNDTSYKNILLGFTYFSEMNPCDLTYDQAIELVKKVLPDDIMQVKSIIDEEVNKEYVYYESSKGNFRVGLSYGYEFNDKNTEIVNENKIVGIDYSKDIK